MRRYGLLLGVVLLRSAVVGYGAPPPVAADRDHPRAIRIDKPLIAYWGFDEDFGTTCRDASGNGHHATPERNGAGTQRTEGVYGRALSFSGNHLLRTAPGTPNLNGLSKVSFSAWTLPTDLAQYREIFRKEDDANRVLFSYQNDGTILSLGLNLNGYVECDARIDPRQVLDGQWHHCGATLDGTTMRVYLDGKEIGALERAGTIAAGGTAAGCIGSTNGGECFQGAIDDLRIYRDALSAEEMARLYRDGIEALATVAVDAAADEPRLEAPLVAHWRCNETGCVVHEAGGTAALELRAAARLGRQRGVHGRALSLQGTHALHTEAGLPLPPDLSRISLSAWTRPTELGGFREIFRQECGERLLFSFQESGTILSLGLNVNGYEECDAKIEPAQLLDGAWHHCAATFDGERMRVYLDGKEIGALARTGTLALNRTVPCFVGSSSGTGEHLQGGLDDLRVYATALTPEQVKALYEAGLAALERFARSLDEQLAAFYAPRTTFAETLAGARRSLVEKQIELDQEVAAVFVARLRQAFPEEVRDFSTWTATTPVDFLLSAGNDLQLRQAERLVGLALEYRPLTDQQKCRESEAEAAKWAEAEHLAQKLAALKTAGDAAAYAPEWISLMLEAGRHIQFRPVVNEAVAPYVTPTTPETRDLTAAEAQAVLEADWLHQADRNPTPERIRNEIAWTRQLVERTRARYPDAPRFEAEVAELAGLETRAEPLATSDPQLYFAVRTVKRRVMFGNPVVDFDKVLFVDMPYPEGSEWQHETRHRLGYMAVPGARLLVLHGLGPTGHLTQLMPKLPLHGSFWRPDVSYDGRKVLFCFKPHNEKSFHLYEMSADGTGLVQLTDGPYDDLDPIYLPDDRHLIFSTTRGHTYVRCMPPTNAYVLARCDRDGGNLYLISVNNEPDYLPSVMNDGRVVYTRWEYTDKPLWRAQGLWTVHPDGTQVNTFWGNQSVWPDLLKDARGIPGSERVMFTGSAHHNWFAGSVGIVDSRLGYNFPNGVTKVTADVAWPESGNGPVDPVESSRYHGSGQYAAYYSPYPLSNQDFLVSANRGGKFVLYLMDVDGNRELVYEGGHNVFHAQPLRARPKPPVLTESVSWPGEADRLTPQPGVIFSGNVYHGAPPELRDRARFLRVLSIDHKTYTYWYKRPYLSTGPVVSGVQSEGVKRVLGTAPVAADGSVSFQAPAGIPLHFQLLDGEQRALQTMRSFVGLMPGERRGCLGCHELHSRTPLAGDKTLALARDPDPITPPPWGQDTVSYERYVRPVLDRYCGKCHQGDGDGRRTFDQTPRPGTLGFDELYWTLTGRPSWGTPYTKPEKPPPGWGIADMIMVEAYDTRDPLAYQTPEPMTRLSYKSRLIELASSGKHHDVKADPESLLRLILWVDTMCPYLGDDEVRAIPDPEFQGVDWLAVRPRIQSAPRLVRPGPLD